MAILAVFAGHAGAPWAHPGFLGVQVFFVLSGYLITSLLLREWDLRGSVRLRRFYARRLLRLYPALIALLLLGLVFYRDVGEGGTLAGYGHTAALAGLYLEDFAYSFSGAHGGLGVTWSLAVEEQFYLLWPPLLLLALRRGGRPWLASVLAIAALLGAIGNQALIHTNLVPGYYFTPWMNATPLIVGCLLAVVMADHRERLLERRIPTIATGVGVVGLIGIWIVDDHVGNGHYYSLQLLACAIAAAALILALELAPAAPVGRLLSWRPLAGLGLISYGFYLCHQVILELISRHLHRGGLTDGLVALAITVAAAAFSFAVIERPFLRIKSRLAGPALVDASSEPAPPTIPAIETPLIG